MKGKVLAVVLAASMLLSMAGVGASAAPKDTANTVAVTQKVSRKVYEIRMNDKEISLVKNGKVIASYESKDGKVTLKKGKTGKVVMMFRDAKTGKQRNIILGDLDAVLFTGKTKSLIISKGFPKDTEIVVDKKAKLDELKVSAEVDVTVKGEVKKIIITTAKADVTVEKGAKVSKVITVSKSAISGVASDKITVEAVKPVSSSSSSSSSTDRGTSSGSGSGSGSGSSETPSTPEEPEEQASVSAEALGIHGKDDYKSLPEWFRDWDGGGDGWDNLEDYPWIAVVFNGETGDVVDGSKLEFTMGDQKLNNPFQGREVTLKEDNDNQAVFTAYIGDKKPAEEGDRDPDMLKARYNGTVTVKYDGKEIGSTEYTKGETPDEEKFTLSAQILDNVQAVENTNLEGLQGNVTNDQLKQNPWLLIQVEWKEGVTPEALDLKDFTFTTDGGKELTPKTPHSGPTFTNWKSFWVGADIPDTNNNQDNLGATKSGSLTIKYKGKQVSEKLSYTLKQEEVTGTVSLCDSEEKYKQLGLEEAFNEAAPSNLEEHPWLVLTLEGKNIEGSKLSFKMDDEDLSNPFSNYSSTTGKLILSAYLGDVPDEDGKGENADHFGLTKDGKITVSYDGEEIGTLEYTVPTTASYSEKEDSEPVETPTLTTEAGKPESTKPTDEPKVDDVTGTAPTVEGTTEGTTGSTVEGTTEGTAGSTVEGTTESTETVPSEDLTPAAPATEE